MRNRFMILILLAYALFSLLYFLPIDIPHKIAIPMAILSIGAFLAHNPILMGACIFSALGDYADFVPKMCFFAMAQVLYITLFARYKAYKNRQALFYGIFFLLVWMAVLVFLLPCVNENMLRGGVAIYSGLLILMCWMSCSSGCIWSALGGLLFLFSDSVLGISHFVKPVPASLYLVMIPYYLGQFLLFLGFLKQSGSIVDLWHVHKRT